MNRKWQAFAILPALLLSIVGCSRQETPVAEEAAPEAPAAASLTKEAMIADALSAAPASMTGNAKVVDWDGNVLREGTGPFTCLPTPPGYPAGTTPMCMDGPWMAWADAWGNKTDLTIDRLGISYMLAGDSGASNTDPFATEETDDNDWVVEGPHLMIITPDTGLLDGLPTDPDNGGPYVMWKGTPYAHIMAPVDLTGTGDVDNMQEDALSAGNADMAPGSQVVDWQGTVLKGGAGPYTCLPTPPQFSDGKAPMCLDGPWMAWADAWANKTDLAIDGLGIAYMLAGDQGASNIDPFASEETADNEWVVEGPHLMVIVPDNSLLADLPTDPDNGGPYVMWEDTPYAHVMVPVVD
jgi:hypothetical protein